SSWRVADDGLSYQFELRPGVRFHDGTAFDASVAKFSLDRARAADSINPQRALLAAIERIEVLAPLQLRLVLKRPAGGLLQALGAGALVMVAPGSAAGNASHPVGTGPFRFAAWRRGEAVELVRNEQYWQTPPQISRLRFQFIGDPSAAYAALMAGDVDVFSNFPAPENLAQFKADPRFVLNIGSSEGETILAINNQRAPLNLLPVRRAIAHALDRRAIIDGAMFGYGIPIGSHFPPGHAAYLDLTGQSAFDPERARALLAEAGLAQGIDLQLKLPPTPYARRSGEIIAAQLAQVGIRLHLQNLEWAQWIDQVYTRHDFDLSVIVHTEPQDYDIYGREGYYFGYRSPRYQALLAQLDARSDTAGRRELLQALQRQLSDDAVNGFLFQYPRLVVRKAQLQQLAFNGVGSVELGQAFYEAGAPELTLDATHAGQGGGPRVTWAALALATLGFAWLLLRAGSPTWLAQRALGLLLTVVVASALIFVLVQLAPGDPARYMLGLNADAQAVANLRQQLGLDAPALQRYGHWVSGLLQGDFGSSYTYRVPVADLLQERLQVSLPLAAYALLLALLIALPVGLLAAHRRGRATDAVLSTLTQLGVALPNFWLGVLLVLIFAVSLRWVPAGGFAGWEAGLWPGLRSLTLPALA
ncbi:MAG: ABC transporter permease subunit, partial [Burkholderiaceae bacterium]|nr:ABC transporter permease subunit [Burkholderiaceae bacterium]